MPAAKTPNALIKLIGKKDAVLLADSRGGILFSKHADTPLIPASTLKILTSLAAIHHLGPNYRFPTEFYLDPAENLKIKGYGDPLLISEELMNMTKTAADRLKSESVKINDLVLDDVYYSQPIAIPGVLGSRRPHDAPNGAICVNFNTVCFTQINGRFVSAEPHTPLLSSALKKIKQTGLKNGRIIFSHDGKENLQYAGELFAFFLKHNGIHPNSIQTGRVRSVDDKLIFRYVSSCSLGQVISKLLEHSNNFMANQILIAAGAKAYGPPGTLEKGVAAVSIYASNILKINNLSLNEGSGISRKNRISVGSMHKILNAFVPYRLLMRREGRIIFKTGTLYGISTMAGFIEGKTGELFRFVVLINSPGKSAKRILRELMKMMP
ncbi:D-alanyl-D-alanine carboxypeptidase/D-alanyl-D-alanine-endopeptidase [Thermodesulfobacteriota bacterium]